MEKITKIITENQEIQISSFLKDNCVCVLSKEFPKLNIGKIKQFIKCIDLIEEIGEIEHSSDWDLYMEFQLEHSVLSSPYGFFNPEISKENLEINLEDFNLEDRDLEDDFFDFVDNKGKFSIPISKIVSMRLMD